MRPWWNAKTKGIYIYTRSPFEQRAFHGFFSHDLKELLLRGIKGSFKVLPIIFGAYGLLHWANKDYHRRIAKNPADYLLPGEELEDSSTAH